MNKDLSTLEQAKAWLKDYEETEEHDTDFMRDMKDEAYLIINALINE